MKLTKRLYLHGWHDWKFLTERGVYWNWIDVTPVIVRFEWASYVPRCEFQIGLLGFHVELEFWRETTGDSDV